MINIFGKLEIFSFYKKGHGTYQHHDICLTHSPIHQYWMLATTRDLWWAQSNSVKMIFDTNTSRGSILDLETRQEWYKHFEPLRKNYNKNYQIQTRAIF
jgi:hypothetical protein